MHFKGFTKNTFNKICVWLIFGLTCYLILMAEISYFNKSYYKDDDIVKRPSIKVTKDIVYDSEDYLSMDVDFTRGYAIIGLTDDEYVRNLFIDQDGMYYLLEYDKEDMTSTYINNKSYITKVESRYVTDIVDVLVNRYKIPLSGEVYNTDMQDEDDIKVVNYGYLLTLGNIENFSEKDKKELYNFFDSFKLLSEGQDELFLSRLQEIKQNIKKL